MLIVLNCALHVLHLAVMFLNTLGWMWPRLRLASLAMQLITVSCWVGFGLAKGWWGYCILTDWHWQVKTALGETDLPINYPAYILENWLGLAVSSDFSSGLILGTFAMAVLVNGWLVLRSKMTLSKGPA
jgi:hypothetical protein